MKSLFAIAIAFVLIGCQKNEIPQSTTGGAAGTPVVQAADGTMYSVDCLRTNSTKIQANGSQALAGCAVDLDDLSTLNESERGKFFNSSYAWVYNPATYCPPNYYYNTYPTSYNPYNDTSYNNNQFCNWAFGSNNFNCYYIFGYTNPTYSKPTYVNSYDASCSSCLYANNITKCFRRCYKQQNLYW
jgi:hypothetical protein